jgi:hypothetical protein
VHREVRLATVSLLGSTGQRPLRVQLRRQHKNPAVSATNAPTAGNAGNTADTLGPSIKPKRFIPIEGTDDGGNRAASPVPTLPTIRRATY